MKTPAPMFAVLITTHNRTSLLAKRSLPSVAAQTRRPDLVVIADDSTDANYRRNEKTVAGFQKHTGIATIHSGGRKILRNTANAITPIGGFARLGHARNRNAAVLAMLAHGCDPHHTWVAVLDDDDAWLPLHLAQAEAEIKHAGKPGVDFLLPAFYWRDPDGKSRKHNLAKFDARVFLVGCTGINGSILIVRLSTLLRAGMFDEALPSCDDRDVCIRLASLPDLHHRKLLEPSAVYYNDDHRSRITQRRSAAKIEGLARFADKYRGWMSDTEFAAFNERSEKLFGWRKEQPQLATRATHSTMPSVLAGGEKIALVCGVIVSAEKADYPLFDDFTQLAKDSRLSSLDVVVVPESTKSFRALQTEIARRRTTELRMYCVDNARARAVMRELGLDASVRRRSIAINRTILQYAMAAVAHTYRNPVAWVLDGDTRLHGLHIRGGRIQKFKPDYIGEMMRLRTAGCDVAISGVCGAAPLPRALSIRTQLVDLLHFLIRLQKRPVQRHFQTLTIANFPHTQIAADYYHDCGSHPHLEQPVGLLPLPENCSLQCFIRELPRLLTRLLAGDAVTRPVLHGMSDDPEKNMLRGGNAAFLNPATLTAMPNGLVRGAFSSARRQDEVWRIAGECAFGWKVCGGNLVVTQTRTNDAPSAPDLTRLAEDVIGHAITRALRATARTQRFAGIGRWRDFLLHHEDALLSHTQAFTRARMSMIYQSFFRIRGIAAIMRSLIEPGKGSPDKRAALRALGALEKKFADEKFQILKKQVNARLLNTDLRTAIIDFAELSKQPYDYSAWSQWLRGERAENAAWLVTKFTPSKKLPRFLGQGSEGTVFTDECRVYKVMHRWYSRDKFSFEEIMPRLTGDWNSAADAVYPILNFHRCGGDAVMVLPLEKTTVYRGGCGPGLIAMLVGMKRRGLVCWNIAPKNLRRAGEAVRFIGYGRDIHPFTQKHFDLSVRKAWLCWHSAVRHDLKDLLTATLKDATFPEVAGYTRMLSAADLYATQYRAADDAVGEVLRSKPRRVLDYGCGTGKDACALAKKGIAVSAFDPFLSGGTRLRAGGVEIINQQQLKNCGMFDAILVRHVLCEIRSDAALRECLSNLRALIKPCGKIVLTACDMSTIVKHKLYAVNLMPRSANPARKFSYQKRIRKSDSVRQHVHRPTEILRREFARAGFKVIAQREFPDIDLEKFEPCGGVLQWVIAPCDADEKLISSSGGLK